MVRTYKRKTAKPNLDAIERALLAIEAGMSIRGAARYFGVSSRSLSRHLTNNPAIRRPKRVSKLRPLSIKTEADASTTNSPEQDPLADERTTPLVVTSQGGPTVFTKQQEDSMMQYILKASQTNCELSSKDVRKMALDFAVNENVAFPNGWNDNKMAGIDWYRGFKRRHPELSVRPPGQQTTIPTNDFVEENVNLDNKNFCLVCMEYFTVWNHNMITECSGCKRRCHSRCLTANICGYCDELDDSD